MASYFFIIRPKNLAIIAATQVILYYWIILPNISIPSLDPNLFSLLVFDTMLLAASGFVINDIFDFRYDVVNKPKKTYIPGDISVKSAILYYGSIVLTGFLTALYIAVEINNLPLVSIYPLAALMLFIYSYSYKNSILFGNVLVSLFVSFVTGIILFAEKNSLQTMTDIVKKQFVMEIFCFYMLFSFLINLLREIIKDIEDIDGDNAASLLTFPIKYGLSITKKLCIIIIFLLVLLLFIWLLNTHMGIRAQSFMILFIAGPLCSLILLINSATDKHRFSKISSIIKWIMMAGLISLIIINSGK